MPGGRVIRATRWLLHRIGLRGAALLFFAELDLVYGAGIVFAPPETRTQPTFRFLASVLPLPVWTAIWASVGLLCLVQAFMRSDRAAYAAASALKIGFGVIHLIGWALGAVPRGYVAAAIWLSLAGLVQVLSMGLSNTPLHHGDRGR